MALPFSTALTTETDAAVKKLAAIEHTYTRYGDFVAKGRGWRTQDDWVNGVNEAVALETEIAKATAANAAEMAKFKEDIEAPSTSAEARKRFQTQATARWQEIRVGVAKRAAKAAERIPTATERRAAPVGWRKEKREAYEAALKIYEADKQARAEAPVGGVGINPLTGQAVPKNAKLVAPEKPPYERLRAEDVPSIVDATFLDSSGAADYADRLVDPLRVYEGPPVADDVKVLAVTAIAAYAVSSRKASLALYSTGAVPLLCNLVLPGNNPGIAPVASLALRNLAATSGARVEAAYYGVGGPKLDTPILQAREQEAEEAVDKAQKALGELDALVTSAQASLSAAETSVAAAQAARDAIDPDDVDSRKLAEKAVLAAQIVADPLRRELEDKSKRLKKAEDRLKAAQAADAAAKAKRVAGESYRVPTIEQWKQCVDAENALPKLGDPTQENDNGLRTQAATTRRVAESAAQAVAAMATAKTAAEAAVAAAATEASKVRAEAAVQTAERKLAQATANAAIASKRADEAQSKLAEAEATVAKCPEVAAAAGVAATTTTTTTASGPAKMKTDAPADVSAPNVARVPVTPARGVSTPKSVGAPAVPLPATVRVAA